MHLQETLNEITAALALPMQLVFLFAQRQRQCCSIIASSKTNGSSNPSSNFSRARCHPRHDRTQDGRRTRSNWRGSRKRFLSARIISSATKPYTSSQIIGLLAKGASTKSESCTAPAAIEISSSAEKSWVEPVKGSRSQQIREAWIAKITNCAQ